jgi:hypothetical protein
VVWTWGIGSHDKKEAYKGRTLRIGHAPFSLSVFRGTNGINREEREE